MTIPIESYKRKIPLVPEVWVPPPPIIEPEITARPAELDEIGKTAKSLMLLARKRGWIVRTTYARGTLVRSKSSAVADSIAVRMQRPGIRLAALWYDGSFETTIWQGTCSMNLALTRAVVGSAVGLVLPA